MLSNDDAKTLLHQYSEWLDGQNLLREPDDRDKRSHDDLVADFIDLRAATALPRIEEEKPKYSPGSIGFLRRQTCIDCGAAAFPHPYSHPARWIETPSNA